MAEAPLIYTPAAGTKRSRVDDDESDALERLTRVDKKARPTSGGSDISNPWSPAQDSVLNTPKSIANPHVQQLQARRYDSDDQDSTISEPGSPQDVAMSSGDEEMEDDDDAAFYSSNHYSPPLARFTSEPWQSFQARTPQTQRVATPILPLSASSTRPGMQPIHVRTSLKQHVRHRHPQEIFSNSSDMLEVPSPIDEDEVPTPPSAAEAAGSQLSMLSVNDMDMEPSDAARVPVISVDPSQALPFGQHGSRTLDNESAIADAFDHMESSAGELDTGLIVRKQRARSGALSSGHGSPSPSRAEPPRPEQNGCAGGGSKRAFSMGFRPECEKCRMRVPGHMNHFVS